ncbi:MAG: AMP phosphorylase [Methanocorpusculum sp.]|nr:AMP phosphorylase [Methanocorpusculum sp.]MBR5449901.1 AMP phosphorylase [Methanocorpusculum sp.]MBR5814833.1 AMP phosphorylase [Methanocorpusculaceae archaeon]
MFLSADIIDIEVPYLLLNISDAKSLGIGDGDRVVVTNRKTKQSISVPVTVSKTFVKEGTALLTAGANSHINISSGSEIEIQPAKRPASLDFIRKKIDGGKLNRSETAAIVSDIANRVLSDAEVTSYITASYINGMDMDEVEYLTREMIASGDTITFSKKPVVDKHSIGGVPGNKITLLVVPIIASSGLLIPKTSSRAITGAGGTADLMEALAPVAFSTSEVQHMTEKAGGVIVWGGATNIVPADDILISCEYPLKINGRGKMLASIIAKKAAVGSDTCVIDIPIGPGTKIADETEGKILAGQLIDLGKRMGINVECAVTYGGAPVGRNIGVNLEVSEAMHILEKKDGFGSLVQKSCDIAGIALEMTGKAAAGKGAEAAMSQIRNGKALDKMREIIEIQGGDPKVKADDLSFGPFTYDVVSSAEGIVVSVKNRALIDIARVAGSPTDHGAGLTIHKKPGETVKKGEILLTIYAEKEWKLSEAIDLCRTTHPIAVSGMLLSRIGPK